MLILGASSFADAPTVRLSPRGKDVLRLFMRGFTYKQISENLGMSISGVRRHREKMLWQNDCESVLELIAKYEALRVAGQDSETRTSHEYGTKLNRALHT